MSNVETVEGIYSAFGRGDLGAILSPLAEEIEWEYGMLNAGVPWLQPLKGRAEVPKFFAALAAVEFRKFEPKTLLDGGRVVVALIDIEFLVKATGKTVAEEDEVHLWHFNDAGHVVKFAHKADTHQHWLALQEK